MPQVDAQTGKVKSTFIPPTIGRKLWYWPDAQFPGVHLPDQPLDANICYVHSDRLINIWGADHNGVPYATTSVELIQEGEEKPPNGRYCVWMGYQIGQAKKHADDKPSPT